MIEEFIDTPARWEEVSYTLYYLDVEGKPYTKQRTYSREEYLQSMGAHPSQIDMSNLGFEAFARSGAVGLTSEPFVSVEEDGKCWVLEVPFRVELRVTKTS